VQIGGVVHLPLNDILAHLPPSVSPLVLARPGGTFSLPIQNAVDQLGTGAVRVRFVELRQSAVPGTFSNDTSQDDALIDLPLPQILAAIGPAAFTRRPNQKITAVPDQVTGVFGVKGAAAPRVAARSAPPVSPIPPAPAPVIAQAPAPTPPTPLAPTPSIKPVTPAFVSPPKTASAPTIKPLSPVTTLKPAAPAPLPFASPKPASPLPFATRPAPPPPVPATPQLPIPVGDDRTLVMTVGAVCQTWPDAVRQEIEQQNLGNASILIPINRVETGMKAGRVVFAWSEVLGWLSPACPTPSSQGTVEVELPLSIIAPLFIGKHRGLVPQKRVTVGENIPDLFGGATKSPGSAPAPSPAPAPAAVPATPVAPAPAPVRQAPETSPLGKLFGQPSKLEWSPQDIARQIAALPGVTGSLLATSDGLLVAGQAPAPLATETLAAFLPQVFGRTANYAEEIKFGTLRGVTIITDSGPCAMFKAGTLYLAVVGKPGQSLPEATLIRIAAELTKSNQ
jgi:predicted regulator of Ras-like GTPase activity (Roadblock/LC7/MglB family)